MGCGWGEALKPGAGMAGMDLLGVASAPTCSGGSSPSFCTETLSMEANSVGGFNDVKTSLLRFVVLFADHEASIRR